MNTSKNSFILYFIYYGNSIIYVGRTKQDLSSRLRGHFFKKPMQREIEINNVTKIEYAELQSEADMFLYEIYFINKYKPPLNKDDKAHDELTITLPEIEFNEYICKHFEKWKNAVASIDEKHKQKKQAEIQRFKDKRIMRQKWHNGEISEDEYYDFIEGV